VGLGDRAHHKPGEMSGGQQQRVSIARALINKPPMLLADEPTGALDSKTGEDVLRLFESLQSQGHTIVLITHDSEIARHANRICVMKDGVLHEGEHHLGEHHLGEHQPGEHQPGEHQPGQLQQGMPAGGTQPGLQA
jgi:putative ABC transport system ATP-binding protein